MEGIVDFLNYEIDFSKDIHITVKAILIVIIT